MTLPASSMAAAVLALQFLLFSQPDSPVPSVPESTAPLSPSAQSLAARSGGGAGKNEALDATWKSKMRVCAPALLALYGRLTGIAEPADVASKASTHASLTEQLRARVWVCLRLLHPQSSMMQLSGATNLPLGVASAAAEEFKSVANQIKSRRGKLPACTFC